MILSIRDKEKGRGYVQIVTYCMQFILSNIFINVIYLELLEKLPKNVFQLQGCIL